MTQISLQSKGLRWLAVFAAALVALLLVIAFFPWDLLRQPINRYVSGQLGRRFEITRHLDVKLGRTTTVIADGVEIANPEWARKAFLLKANSAEFDIRVWPLFFGSVQIPRISLKSPEFGLQAESDGRRSWALARDTSDAGAVPDIGSFLVDQGVLSYIDTAQGADIAAQFSVASEAARDLPLDFKATGKWKGEKFTADGRTGGVLKLSKNVEGSFPLQVNAMVGRTSLKANGTLTDLAELGGVDVSFDLQGKNLDELYKLTGVVLPSTPPYKVRGKLLRKGDAWIASQMQGTLGRSDVSGALTFDQSAEVAMLTGKLQSKLLDFEDLAPVIGLAPAPQAARASKPLPAASAVAPGSAGSQSARAQPTLPASRAPAADRTRKVLPTAVLDLAKLKSMNADVTYSAADIRHVKELPLDEGRIHVLLKNGVLQMDPISLGVAGGSIVGSIKVDSNPAPAAFNARLDVRGAQLNKLFPTVETTKSSLGKISGKFDLNGRGNSAAQMLGGASGDVAILMGRGELSNILLEFMGLDGGEVIKFLVRGDRNVQLRCAAAAFDVKQGVMTSRAIVLDTSDTVINGRGQVSFANETLDLVLDPAPKDFSILSFRSPLRIGGTFAAPNAFPDKGALAGRAGIALALAAINPLLALAATVETGPGEDADCAGVLAEAQKGKASARSASPGLKAVR
jgi:AsmA family protein